ncbi:sulfite exporter TauE/SafE family protein [Shewanella salipaludis]|uniref:Probable membrane transporter protein n=1 Tax=Shewanella salipaludis TaxID=2723052 RepID=A0A972JJG2_9GAMM|nr:sulfite exporter TauE/SafE family protein [Shewanella salipaludis]NMH64014.1 sulfite exporter TauE/SafE family protein [Shewanella salipaludis]
MPSSWLQFDAVPADIFALLTVTAAFTSFFTACFGIGGGVMLLGVMAQVLPPQLIIPLHGVVQLGSNGGRVLLGWQHIQWRVIGAFLPGAIIGALLGSFVLVALPPSVMYLTIAAFILYSCWGPKLPKMVLGTLGTFMAGAMTTFISLFAGATGPLVAAFMKQLEVDRFRTVATFAMAMSLQHGVKIVVFEGMGVSLDDWWPVLVCMILSGALGTWIGFKMLKRLADKHFHTAFSVVLTLLAIRLIWQAIGQW